MAIWSCSYSLMTCGVGYDIITYTNWDLALFADRKSEMYYSCLELQISIL